jgi:hypothetical protein
VYNRFGLENILTLGRAGHYVGSLTRVHAIRMHGVFAYDRKNRRARAQRQSTLRFIRRRPSAARRGQTTTVRRQPHFHPFRVALGAMDHCDTKIDVNPTRVRTIAFCTVPRGPFGPWALPWKTHDGKHLYSITQSSRVTGSHASTPRADAYVITGRTTIAIVAIVYTVI